MKEVVGQLIVGAGRYVVELGEWIRGPVKQPHPNDPSVQRGGLVSDSGMHDRRSDGTAIDIPSRRFYRDRLSVRSLFTRRG